MLRRFVPTLLLSHLNQFLIQTSFTGLIIGHYNPKKIKLPAIPTDTAFLSISIGHSRKPILLDLLRPYLPLSSPPSHPNVLEFFARTVMAGSVAVGNEAIKFNVLDEEGTLGWICNSGGAVSLFDTFRSDSILHFKLMLYSIDSDNMNNISQNTKIDDQSNFLVVMDIAAPFHQLHSDTSANAASSISFIDIPSLIELLLDLVLEDSEAAEDPPESNPPPSLASNSFNDIIHAQLFNCCTGITFGAFSAYAGRSSESSRQQHCGEFNNFSCQFSRSQP